jgi:hypothetical protein
VNKNKPLMNLNDILIGKFFPNPLVEGKTYLALNLPEKGEIQFDFLNEKSESLHREHCYPQTWGDTIVFDLAHLPKGSYDVQIKIGKHVVPRSLEIEKPKVKPLKKVHLLLSSILPGWLLFVVSSFRSGAKIHHPPLRPNGQAGTSANDLLPAADAECVAASGRDLFCGSDRGWEGF